MSAGTPIRLVRSKWSGVNARVTAAQLAGQFSQQTRVMMEKLELLALRNPSGFDIVTDLTDRMLGIHPDQIGKR